MARERHIVAGFLKAASLRAGFGKLLDTARTQAARPGKWHAATKKDPMFRAAKVTGAALAGTGAIGYGIHKATSTPEPKRVPVGGGPQLFT